MSTNAGPVYREAEARFRAAVTREEKLAALEEMLRVVPKHKGTEKLCADLRSRISKLKHEPRRKGGTRGPSHKITHEGAGQVALVGPPNSGKSTLVAELTHADPGRRVPARGPPSHLSGARGTLGLRHHPRSGSRLVGGVRGATPHRPRGHDRAPGSEGCRPRSVAASATRGAASRMELQGRVRRRHGHGSARSG
jgi:hypothetical protein